MMVSGLFVLFLVRGVGAKPSWRELESYDWSQYKVDFGKEYEGTEDVLRRMIFSERLAEIKKFNDGPGLYKKGVNAMTDLTEPERLARFGGGHAQVVGSRSRETTEAALSSTREASRTSGPSLMADEEDELQGLATLDWRKSGIVSPVKDQGSCGSCWAFASTETIESYVALNTGSLPLLSPQQLVSCAQNPYSCGGTGGCEGSIPELAFSYVQLYGQTTEANWPYEGVDVDCGAAPIKAEVAINGFQKVRSNDKDAVLSALLNGPLAVNVDATAWHDYDSGVFDGCSNGHTNNTDLNHVVQLVGYDYDPDLGAEYWIVRNSWDSTWGEDGYVRLKKSSDAEPCSVDHTPLDGTGCDGGPVQTVCGECGVIFDASFPLGARFVEDPSSSSSSS